MIESATRQAPPWRGAVAPFERPDTARSILDLATSALPYIALTVAMYLLLNRVGLVALALAPLAAGFLLRTYIVFHDCAHGSFLHSKRANTWLGVAVGLLVYSPFHAWRHEHAVHHATSGDLDRRGVGDVETWTVNEYLAKPALQRVGYRLFRNPLVMLSIGPLWALMLEPRKIPFSARARIRNSHLGTNLALVLLVGLQVWAAGWQAYLLVTMPTVLIAGAAGVWLFYVQHQFEDAYWESGSDWNYAYAALRGSSYLKLPKVLQFFTGNIGLHHVHHLSARIPNYNLQRAHDANPMFQDVPTLSIMDGMRALRLKLWDERGRRLVTFAEAHDARRARLTETGMGPATSA